MIRSAAHRAGLTEDLLGSGRNPREAASTLRRAGRLLGIPDSAGTSLYPAFQLNRELGARGDPWDVAPWWISGHGRLSGRRPKDLLGRPEEHELLELAVAESEE